MLPIAVVGDKFFLQLLAIDLESCRRVAEAGCSRCGGPLHRSDYPRKPRGGLLAIGGEGLCRRLSLCCGWTGCRRRATPPSVVFLGRRVYLGVAVILASLAAQLLAVAREVKRATGIAARTVGRWRGWWQAGFTRSRIFEEQRGRFLPPLVISELPASLVGRFEVDGRDAEDTLLLALAFLAPLTTSSVADGSRWVRLQ